MIDDASQLDTHKATGVLSSDGTMLHGIIPLIHVEYAPPVQFIILSRDGDGVTRMAALANDKDADAYNWNGKT